MRTRVNNAAVTLQRQYRHALVAGFAIVFAAACGIGYLAHRTSEAEGWVSHTLTVQKVARELIAVIQEGEANQRSFLLLGEASYLQKYTTAFDEAPQIVARLKEITADNDAQEHRLAAVDAMLKKRIEVAQTSVDLARAGQVEEAVKVVRKGEGSALTSTLQKNLNDLIEEESDLLRDRQSSAATLRNVLFPLIAAALLGVSGLAVLVGLSSRLYLRSLSNEIAQREAAETSLRQAQKMEAVGQLTGGIAHDFNNLLTIVLGNLDIIARKIAHTDYASQNLAQALVKPVSHAIEGGKRAAELTHRLLAFSRQQPLEPKVVDINRLVADMGELLRRTVTENIEIQTVTAGGLWRTMVDANQLENAVLNLVLNARDAMPSGGRITIETGNAYLDEGYVAKFGDVSAGQYTLLSVADTGSGIPAKILDRVFEPFFTTKGDGKGSGLGLAMVHGFVKQSGGHIRIYSEPDQGTTVKIYLPRSDGEAQNSVSVSLPNTAKLATGTERILLVEDDEGVRTYACSVLCDLGYSVEAVGDAATALAKLDGVDLLFTDVVLPGGMNGRHLSEEVRRVVPKLPVLFTTGYTRNAIVHHGRLDAGVKLLTKPYTQAELAQKVREALDEKT